MTRKSGIGPNKRHDTVPESVIILCPAGAHSRKLVMFMEKDNRLALQIEEPEGGAEIILNQDQLALLCVNLQRYHRKMIGASV